MVLFRIFPSLFPSASGTYSRKIHPALDGGVARLSKQLGVTRGHITIDIQVIHAPAADASDMMVPAGMTVETHLRSAEVEPADHPAAGKQLEVSIDRSQAYSRHQLSHLMVQLIRRGVRLELPQLFEYEPALLGQPYGAIILHSTNPHNQDNISNNYYY
jgi:hypothetical protein